MVDEMISEVNEEWEKRSYEFLGILVCTTKSITGIFVPLLGLLWTAVVNFVDIVGDLMSKSYV